MDQACCTPNRVRCGTRKDSRALTPFKQAVLILRWFLDGTRVKQLAVDNAAGTLTVYDYLNEGFTVLAGPPGLSKDGRRPACDHPFSPFPVVSSLLFPLSF